MTVTLTTEIVLYSFFIFIMLFIVIMKIKKEWVVDNNDNGGKLFLFFMVSAISFFAAVMMAKISQIILAMKLFVIAAINSNFMHIILLVAGLIILGMIASVVIDKANKRLAS